MNRTINVLTLAALIALVSAGCQEDADSQPQAVNDQAQQTQAAPLDPELLAVLGEAPVEDTDSIIAADDFETDGYQGGAGWANAKWLRSSRGAAVTTEANPMGNFNLKLWGGGSYFRRPVNLAGLESATFKFQWRTEDFEPGDHVLVTVRMGDKGKEQTIGEITTADANSAWQTAEYDISQYIGPETHVGFRGRIESGGEAGFFVDNVRVTKAVASTRPAATTQPVAQ